MTALDKLKQTITVSNLVAAAGNVYFQRGEDYARDGLVRNLHFERDQLCALVDGSTLYETFLFEVDGELDGHCTCPLGTRDEFCKHLVATGLAWIAQQEEGGAIGGSSDSGRSDLDILDEWLQKQKKAKLVELLLNRSVEDSDFFDQLLIKASATKPSGDLREMKRAIQQAYRIGGFVDWRNTRTYYSKLDQVNDVLRDLLERGEADPVIELVEYAMKRWETAIQHIDDSDGGMGMVRDELHELHHNACTQAKPDPEKLAERLFKIAFTGDWDMFYTAYDDYMPIWGTKGRNRYRELVEAEWKKLPCLKVGDKDPDRYGRSTWLSDLMQKFAQEDGSLEQELDVLQRDLSNEWDFLKLAQRCEKAKQIDDAVDWIEEGLRYFKDDTRLNEKRYQLYWKQRRYDEALSIVWNLFEKSYSLESYKELTTRAKQRKQLKLWKAKALASIRANIAEKRKKVSQGYRDITDHSLLVEIFLWGGDVEAAWRDAVNGGCSENLWLKLCKKREATHPADIFPIYLKLAERRVQQANNQAYHEAVKLIQKARKLAKSCDQSETFTTRFEEIRTKHKPKRNFMKYLGEAGL